MTKQGVLAALTALLLCCIALPVLGTIEQDEPIPYPNDRNTPQKRAYAPIELSTPQALADIANNPGREYVLASDIDMKGFQWVPFPFSGTLDGAGHTVFNLYVDQPGTQRTVSVDGNRVEYDTVFAGLFSHLDGAAIKDLTLKNIRINVTTVENCFLGGLAGYARDVIIQNVRVSGRLHLTMSSRMGGVGGIIGFGNGTISHSAADVELVFVDTNRKVKCEQFMGGIAACGYLDLQDCSVKLEGYASVHGYVHSGGLLGMYHVHDGAQRKVHPGYVRGCTVDGHIRFFENNKDRRAYCRRFVGEELHRNLEVTDNAYTRFIRDERDNFRINLLPEMCETPVYRATVTQPTAEAFGFTAYTCLTCGYVFTDDFTAPLPE